MEKQNTIKSFRGKYDFLSIEYPCFIDYDSMRFSSVSRAYHAAKSWDIRHRIGCQLAQSEQEVRRWGKSVKPREDWEKVRIGIMYDLLEIKFKQPKLRQQLLDTGDAILVWENQSDRFWGQVKGEGQNRLGKHLMSIRAKLQK